MKQEIRVSYDKLSDVETITDYNEREVFEKNGYNIHRHECDVEDDHDRQERVYKIQTEKRYFFT